MELHTKAGKNTRLELLLHVIDSVNEWVGRIGSLLILVISGIMVSEVVARYIFNSPTIWSFEVTGFLFFGYIVLGGGYTLLYKQHVNTDILYTRLTSRIQAIIDLVTAIPFFIFSGVLLFKGWEYAWHATEMGQHSGTPWNPPIFIVLWILPLGASLLILQGIAKFMRDLIIASTDEGDRI